VWHISNVHVTVAGEFLVGAAGRSIEIEHYFPLAATRGSVEIPASMLDSAEIPVRVCFQAFTTIVGS